MVFSSASEGSLSDDEGTSTYLRRNRRPKIDI